MRNLSIRAGRSAWQHVRRHGLRAADVKFIVGASGAAKWLTICGLDKAIFSNFLAGSEGTVSLFGTSIGAFKLAAAAREDSAGALTRLAEAYVEQSYPSEVTPAVVTGETLKILDSMLGTNGAAEILASTRFRLHCGTVRCHGLMASDRGVAQRAAMVKAILLSAVGKKYLRRMLHRAVFSDPRDLGAMAFADGHPTEQFALTEDNLRTALLASGSIPLVMTGVTDLPEPGGRGVYRDGGVLDYHPVPSNVMDPARGLVLYPHFYSYLVEVWFDKFFANRHIAGDRLDNVILVGPGDDYVASLPGGRIPDRKDFYTFAGNDRDRQSAWRIAIERSDELGEEFLDLARSGKIADVVVPFD